MVVVVVISCVLCGPRSRFFFCSHVTFLQCELSVLLFLLDVRSPAKPLLQPVSLSLYTPLFQLGSLLLFCLMCQNLVLILNNNILYVTLELRLLPSLSEQT